MRFASAFLDGRPVAGLIDGDRFVPLDGVDELGAATGCDLLHDPPLARGGSVLLDAVELRPVVPRPGKVICLGLNYREHVEETGRELPAYPVLFTKFASTLAPPGAPIALPRESEQVDFEGELAIVVGRRVRRLPREAALDAVAGFTVANDVTMRDYQYKTHQWLQGKAWERSTPLGPHLVTPDEVGDPGTLDIRLELNGETMQSANTSLLIFDVPAILSHLSEFVTLEPGDVILTGSPAGVGYRRDPQVFLAPGDRLRVEIERVGVLESTVVAESELSAAPPPVAAER